MKVQSYILNDKNPYYIAKIYYKSLQDFDNFRWIKNNICPNKYMFEKVKSDIHTPIPRFIWIFCISQFKRNVNRLMN